MLISYDLQLWVTELLPLSSLYLEYNSNILISVYCKVSRLELSSNSKDESMNFSSFYNLRSLSIRYYFELKSLVINQDKLKELSLQKCEKLTFVNDLSNIRFLSIRNCPGLTDMYNKKIIKSMIIF
jgi:hypothetical protein